VKPKRLRGSVFLASGLAALSVALSTTQFRFVAIVVGLACFLLGATALSQAGQLVPFLRPFVKRSVRVQVWGAPLPASGGSTFDVDSVMALSAGLLIHLRPSSGGPRTLLKVAQPGSVRLGDGQVEVGEARYVSWGGTKVTPVVGHPALAVLIASGG
jgi:hypothetical protein